MTVKLLPFIKIYDFGVYPYMIEDNEYCGRAMFIDKENNSNSTIEWFSLKQNYKGMLRKNGPALHTINYSAQIWNQEPRYGRHRLDGPWMIYSNGKMEFYIDDKFAGETFEEFERYKKLMVLL